MRARLLVGRKQYLREKEPLLPPISRTFVRRVFHAACLFYASFFLHGFAVYSARADEPAPAITVERRTETCPPGRGVLEPLLRALVPASGTAPVTSGGGAR